MSSAKAQIPLISYLDSTSVILDSSDIVKLNRIKDNIDWYDFKDLD
jgi:hypothetical protein